METKPKPTKKIYSTPKLVVYGSVEVITRGNHVGSYLDFDFQAGTFIGDLTFSDQPSP